jgi:multidrug efflux system membrane fusion protein
MARRRFGSVIIAAALAAGGAVQAQTPAAALASAPVRAAAEARSLGFDGTVEAVRQTVLAAQVPGAVVGLDVRVADRVKAGQTLVRIDARAADQTAAATSAQVTAIRASLEVATKELERQRQLFQKEYISRAALERAEAQYTATRAQLDAQAAQAGAARTQSGLHRVSAPYAGVVAEVAVELGDMAMPGRPLLSLYDPTAMRVTVAVPQSVGARPIASEAVRIALGATADRDGIRPTRVTVLPTVDAATHTVQLRLDLPSSLQGVSPGAFARVSFSAEGTETGRPPRLFVPAAALVRRAELSAVYVIDPQGRPLLRQVRPGPALGTEIEILAGVTAGERVALDPQAAARVR